MKNLIFIAIATFTSFAMSQTVDTAQSSLSCYGAENVDQSAPFVLTLNDVNEFQVNLIMEEMITDGLLNPFLVFNIDNVQILNLSVNTDMIASVDWTVDNETVNQVTLESVKLLMKKYKIKKSKYNLDCTYTAEGQPKAGGMN